MRRHTLLSEAGDLLAHFISRVRGAAALGLTDINKISEGFIVDLFREVFGLPGLRDLNAETRTSPAWTSRMMRAALPSK
jgi:hypothetical protein